MKLTDELRAWRESSSAADGPEAEAAALVSGVEAPAPLSPQAVARIRAAVRTRARPAVVSRAPRARRWSVAFAAVLLGASVTTAAGTTLVWRALSQRTAARPAMPPEPASRPPVRAPRSSAVTRRRASAELPAAEGMIAVAPTAATEPAAAVSPPPLAPPPLAPSPPARAASQPERAASQPEIAGAAHPAPRRALAGAAVSPFGGGAADLADAPPSETRLLGESVRLNRQGDPAGALRLLDRYGQLYPTGVLAAEARRVRLAALLHSGDHRAALALADAAPALADAGPELLLVRAELRAEADRCAEAIADFERVLEASPDDATVERSTFGRAVCLARAGRPARAREALAAYRARFPRGRFSADVARMLGESGGGNSP